MFFNINNKFIIKAGFLVTGLFSFPVYSDQSLENLNANDVDNSVILVNFYKNALFSGIVCAKKACSQTLHLGDKYIIHNPKEGDEVCVRIYDAIYYYDYLFKYNKQSNISEINFWGTITDRAFDVTKSSIQYIKGEAFGKYQKYQKNQRFCDKFIN